MAAPVAPAACAPVGVLQCRLVVVSASEPSRMLLGCLRVQTSCSFLNSLLEEQGKIRSLFFPLLPGSGDTENTSAAGLGCLTPSC